MLWQLRFIVGLIVCCCYFSRGSLLIKLMCVNFFTLYMYRVWQKCNCPSYFAHFSATTWTFLIKLCTYILCLCISPYKCQILFNYLEIWQMCDFKCDNPTVLAWLNRQEHITNCTTKFFLQQSNTNCSYYVTLSVESVHH